MTAALKISFPPRMMRRATAAAYLDMAPAEFEREVAAGSLPMPVRGFGNVERWSTAALDAAIDRLTGELNTTWRHKAKLYDATG